MTTVRDNPCRGQPYTRGQVPSRHEIAKSRLPREYIRSSVETAIILVDWKLFHRQLFNSQEFINLLRW